MGRPYSRLINTNVPFDVAYQRALDILTSMGVRLRDADVFHGTITAAVKAWPLPLDATLKVSVNSREGDICIDVESRPFLLLLDCGISRRLVNQFVEAWNVAVPAENRDGYNV